LLNKSCFQAKYARAKVPNALGIPTLRATILPGERLELVGESADGDVVEVVEDEDIGSVEVEDVVLIIGERIKVVKSVDSVEAVEVVETVEGVEVVEAVEVIEAVEVVEVVEIVEVIEAVEVCHLLVLAG
jgi:hypothetical protein